MPVTVRPAVAGDVDGLAALMFVEPSREAVVLTGGADRAEAFERELLRRALGDGSPVLVASDEGELVGFALLSSGGDVPPLPEVARMAVRAMGVRGALVAGWRSISRARVDLTAPPGGMHLVELQVHPHRRGGGIGGLLLDAVVAHAVAAGSPHLSLTTGVANPARRLYERHGFSLVAEKRDARYERLTGIPGRVLLVKDLGSGGA